jgi:ribosomal protein S18 acetylase RimI-like enzyme
MPDMQTYKLDIQKVEERHLPVLEAICKSTFQETYSWYNTAENMANYLNENFSYEKLKQEIESDTCSYYLLYTANEAIGYMKLNFGFNHESKKDAASVEIERIYTLKQYHGKGQGQRLCDEAIKIAKTLNASNIWLGVWEKNPRAMAFYSKNNFKIVGTHIFKLGSDEQLDHLMVLNLNS